VPRHLHNTEMKAGSFAHGEKSVPKSIARDAAVLGLAGVVDVSLQKKETSMGI
jgi:hypothetical protein